MKNHRFFHGIRLLLTICYYLLVAFPIIVSAAEVTLQWDANAPVPDGYRLFMRQSGDTYDYNQPIWSGQDTTHVVQNLTGGATYFFVVRAYEGEEESGDSNEVEYLAGNTPPDTPVLTEPADQSDAADLSPALSTEAYFDADGDAHQRTQYQIALDNTFSAESLVYDHTSYSRLTSLSVVDLILDPETVYYWRVRFFDVHNSASNWSDPFLFTTVDYSTAGDANLNGVLDSQEIDAQADLDNNGTADVLQEGILAVNTPDSSNPQIAVKRNTADIQIVAMKAYSSGGLGLAGSQPDNMTGLVSFKLYLNPGVMSASVTVYLTTAAPADAQWYKYDQEEGWTAYPNATFAADRRSVTITLQDGGIGDQDGVQNGVIVDPAGLGYSSSTRGSTYVDSAPGAGAGGCFIGSHLGEITNGAQNFNHLKSFFIALGIFLPITICGCLKQRKR